MPNWCNNNITISGPKEKLESLSKAAEAGELFNFMYPRSKDLDITAGSLGSDTCPEQIELVKKENANLEKHGFKNWYDWSVANWGTKWDVSECYANEINDNTLTLAFDTAWGPALGAYEHYTRHNNDISIKGYYYEPGMDFMGCWQDGFDEFYQLSDVPDKDLEGQLSEFDDLYGILESRHQYRDELIEDGRYDDAKEWLMNHAQMTQDDAEDYINEHRIDKGIKEMKKENQNA